MLIILIRTCKTDRLDSSILVTRFLSKSDIAKVILSHPVYASHVGEDLATAFILAGSVQILGRLWDEE